MRFGLNPPVSHGGALVSRIHEETNHGDPSVRTLMNRILEDVGWFSPPHGNSTDND